MLRFLFHHGELCILGKGEKMKTMLPTKVSTCPHILKFRNFLLIHLFGQVVKAYIKIMVNCCLQDPPVTFTDDLGTIQRYDEGVHSEPIDGDALSEWCVVVFPALVVATARGEPELLEQRFILARSYT